ncbi:MAG: hypothetical protein RLZZ241_2052 [Bacteroidota bacterium]|jgi:cytochrome c
MRLRKLLLLGIVPLIALSCKNEPPQLAANEKPDDNRFTKITLTEGMDEPMAMEFLPGGRIIIVERKGGVKIFDEASGRMTLVTTIPVNTKYTNKEGRTREAEEGLMGVVAHPDFEQNHWIYLYYADPDDSKHVLVRWELNDYTLDPASKTVVLEIPTQREECCHTGGGMVFDDEGNLFLTVGNNTVNPRTGSSNLDDRPGYENNDDQRAPGNTNDLRGKILRIHPEPEGGYTIPKGNLFPEGTEGTRPEIYTMGHRNPWRVTRDSKTGYIYWGEVGPDANVDSVWGPRGYDEFNQAKGPGFFGWPYFIADNQPYNQLDADTGTYGEPFDPNHVVNNSRNNTGLKELPGPPVPAFIYYPYGPSEKFPLVGSSGRSATGGPVYRREDFPNAERPFPAYYEGKWLIIDFMRDWIMSVTMDENGDYVSMERFAPTLNFSAAIDIKFAPSGDLYILEYGDAWFRKNANSRLVKLEYNGGNRKPLVAASANVTSGKVPLSVELSSVGTMDFDSYDSDLDLAWNITSENGYNKTIKGAAPELELTEPGVYQVTLTVKDSYDATNSESFEIVAGNEAPTVSVDLSGANRTFYFGASQLSYSISVEDTEDGSTATGAIKPEEVAITFDYIPQGFDPIEVAANQVGAEMLAVDAIARNLIETNDCKSCHQYKQASIGPSYETVAGAYPNTPETIRDLVGKVINGSSGVWGEHAMAAHPDLSEADAERMVRYIMSLLEDKPTVTNLALAGVINPQVPKGEDGSGVFLLRAAYADKGADLKSLSGEDVVALRNPVVYPQEANVAVNTQLLTTPRTNFFMLSPSSNVGYWAMDLTGVDSLEVFVQTSPRNGALGGVLEVHLDAPDGPLAGTTGTFAPEEFNMRGMFGAPPPTTPEEIKARRRMGSQTLSVDLSGVNGIHDVYLVFRNADAAEGRVITSLREVEFYGGN